LLLINQKMNLNFTLLLLITWYISFLKSQFSFNTVYTNIFSCVFWVFTAFRCSTSLRVSCQRLLEGKVFLFDLDSSRHLACPHTVLHRNQIPVSLSLLSTTPVLNTLRLVLSTPLLSLSTPLLFLLTSFFTQSKSHLFSPLSTFFLT